LRFASGEQSLPGNHVVGPIEIRPYCLVVPGRPDDDTKVKSCATWVITSIRVCKLIVVRAIDPHIIWRPPRIVPRTVRVRNFDA